MSIKEMTLLDVIELSNRMDAASRDVSACGALRPAQRVSQRSCRFPAWFHPGITPLAPRFGPLESITGCRLYLLRSQFRVFGSCQGSPRRLIVGRNVSKQ